MADLVVHLLIDILTARAGDDANDAKSQRGKCNHPSMS